MKGMCIAMLACIACLTAASKTPHNGNRIFDIKVHNINQVEMCVSNYGKFGQTAVNDAGCWWPKNSGENYIFGAGFWFGTIDSITGDTLVSVGYNPHDGASEFIPGLDGQNPYAQYTMVYLYPNPWPAPLDSFPMAPQEHVSHQDSWCCFNDLDSTAHVPGDTRPIGLEVYQTVYAWDTPPIEDVIFLIQEVKNISGHTLQDCYFGVCMDNDIGNESGTGNDICSGILERTYIIGTDTVVVDDLGYQWQEVEESGWSQFPGVIGVDLLQTPFDLVAGQDKDGDGIPDQYEDDSAYYWNNVPPELWDVDNDGVPDWRDPNQWPQIGMTAFKRFTLNLEPNMDNERYMTLAGYNFVTGEYVPYDTVPVDPDDQRFLLGTGHPFDLQPDSSVTIIIAVMFAYWHDTYLTPDSALVFVDEEAQLWYDQYWFLYGIEEHSSNAVRPRFTCAPNPAVTGTQVSFTVTRPGAVSLKLYNIAGQLVRVLNDEYCSAGDHVIQIRTEGLSTGTYYVVLKTADRVMSQPLVVMQR